MFKLTHSRRFLLALILVLLAALFVSIVALQYVFSLATQYYMQVNQVRLDPFELNHPFSSVEPLLPGQKRVIFFGDSRAEQWPVPDDPAFQFVNRGIGGETSAQTLGRFAAQVAPLHPDVVVLQICINDLKTIPIFPDEESIIEANCLANIRDIIRQSNEIGATVILTTIFPVTVASIERRLFFWSDAVARSIRVVNGHLSELTADHVRLLDTYALLAENGLTRPDYAADTLHLNADGYAALNPALLEVLRGDNPTK